MFGYTIIKEKELKDVVETLETFNQLIDQNQNNKEHILKEIKRLKEESWDKQAFDRLYDLIEGDLL